MILLNFDDTLLYQQHDFTQQVRQELKKLNIPYAVHIAAPKFYYLDSDKELPVFISIKENNIDNKKTNTAENGYLIFSNNKTADIHINKTFQNTKERPYQTENKTPTPSNAPPGWRPPKTTYYKSEYRLLKKTEIPNVAGTWTVLEHSGSFISNPQTIEISYNNKNKKNDFKYIDSPFLSTEELGINTTFSKNKSSPPINIHKFGLETPLLNEVNKNKTIILNGSFSIKNSIDISRGYLPIHLMISGNNLKHSKIITLKIPKDKLTSNNNSFEGYFSLDIMPAFNNNELENRKIEKIYITIISGALTSKVFSITN